MRTPTLRTLTGAAALLLGLAATASAAVTPFTARYSTNAAGDIAIVGNTVLTCPASAGTCASVQAGANGINNSFAMEHVDIDGDGSTFNSSSATLTLPADAQVLFAGLYWGGRTSAGGGGGAAAAPNAAARATVRLRVPGGAYATVSGTETGSYDSGAESAYQAFADVTGQVGAAGNGAYTLADVQVGTGSNTYGGWSLVVAYRDDAAPPRNLAVFDGLEVVSGSSPSKTITVTGIQAPPSGAVTARVGVIAYDGDRGSTGDSLTLNGVGISDALHPANDIFNSSIADRGNRLTAKSPDHANNLGMDASVFTADGIIANGATSATIDLTTGGETYLPGVVTSAIDLFAPRLVVNKSVADVDGGMLLAGDTLEYTVSVGNTGTDAATNVVLTDTIPTGTTLVPGSLRATAGDGAGLLTDASADDRGDASASGIGVRLGSGATGAVGGSLAVNATTTAVFRVRVDPTAATGTRITNRAAVSHRGAGSGVALLARSTTVATTVQGPAAPPATAPAAARLSITVAGPRVLRTGRRGDYVVTVRSLGPATARDVRLRIPVPAGMAVRSLPQGFRLVNGVVVGPTMTMPRGTSRRVVLGLAPTSARAGRSASLRASATGAAVRQVQDRTPVRVLPAARPAPAVAG